ncbi:MULTISPECIES: thiamine phosphate synthase [Paenibacillus]|uniref:thiamine phosphate synthase n=1 Tax=Paenibacillus TaxID=44249 RepID=UPI0022B8C8FE|nr:thiamine phosphate synthase [Paenibacillus caseinilyticus]MCZ8518117.1 thiamine phosphate synthase [Paenibacillus caseinilyticus]
MSTSDLSDLRPSPRIHALHVLTTGRLELEDIVSILGSSSAGMIDMLHIREKHRSAHELAVWYKRLKPLLPQGSELAVNDRLDAALSVRADAVQLTGASLSPAEARELAPPGTLRIGSSVHSPAEAVLAAGLGADFVLYGHVYETGSKPGLAPRGLQALADTVEASPVPVIAIGGIDPERVDEVLSTGAAGIAVLSSVFGHPDPAAQLRAYRDRLDRTTHTPRKGWI